MEMSSNTTGKKMHAYTFDSDDEGSDIDVVGGVDEEPHIESMFSQWGPDETAAWITDSGSPLNDGSRTGSGSGQFNYSADDSQDGGSHGDVSTNEDVKSGEVEIEISPENLVLLETEFRERGRYCKGKHLKELQKKTGLPEKAISRWLRLRKIRADDIILTAAFVLNPFPSTKEMLSLMNRTRFTSINKVS